ncbi:MAG: hypothetical protein H7122_12285 [Chitinophagaceae bacterium]|nr:hypothetical protein [Chitinophagaceae bacterium]
MTRLFYCLLIFAIAPGSGRAQKLLFQHFGTEKGLIQSNINHIVQDKKGNIWIGTNAGISVYDGKKFTNYDDLQKLSNLRINNIICDQKGIVWIATDNAILKFDKNFTRVFRTDTPTIRRIFQLTVDTDNNKYFIYNREIYKISDTGNLAVKWNINIPSRSPITVLSVDPFNNFWVGTANAEAFKISNGQVTRLKGPSDTDLSGSTPLGFFSIKTSSSNYTSYVTTHGVFIVENDSLVYIRDKYNKIPARSRTNSVIKTSQSSVWLATDSGVLKFTADGKYRQFSKMHDFTNYAVTCIFEDLEKNIWFGTYGNGIFKLSTESISLYDQEDQIDFSNIEYFTKTIHGDIILGTYGQGIIKMKGQNFIKNPFSSRTPFLRFVNGLAAKGRHTFISTYGQGIYQYDNITSVIKEAPLNIQEPVINALLPYKAGFLVFAGGRFMYSFNNEYALVAKKEMPTLTSLFGITDSTLLLIQNNQTDIYDANLNLIRKNLFYEIHSRLSCLEFYGNYILAGTIGEGLFLYDKEYRFLKKLPSRSNIIYSLKVSGNHLFIGSNIGLSKIPIRGFPKMNNDEENIIFRGECKEEGILSLNDDTILVTSSKGLFVINTKENDFNFTIPILSIESLQFKNNEDQLTSDLTDTINRAKGVLVLNIPYNKHELLLSLKGVSQSSPEFLQYQFILQNYEDKWNITDNADLIRYTNLQPGNYVFKARLYAKGIASPLIEIPFTIDKPLQAKWWFQLFVFTLFILFAIFLLKIFNRLNQRYIQTKWIDRSTNELQTKKTLIGQLVKSTKKDLQLFRQYLVPRERLNNKESERYLEFYFETTLSRLDLLWEKDFMNLNQLNETLRSFTKTSFDTIVEISHTTANDTVMVPSEKAEKIIRLFSLFIFYSVETNQAKQFALTSKIRFGNQLFLKIYSTETVSSSTRNSIHRHLENSIRELNSNHFSIEFIESQNLGNMIILSMNLESNHVMENEFH